MATSVPELKQTFKPMNNLNLITYAITYEENLYYSLIKQPTMRDATDWLKKISHTARPISRHYQHPGSDARVIIMECLCSFLRLHFAGKLVVAKCRLFSQDNSVKVPI